MRSGREASSADTVLGSTSKGASGLGGVNGGLPGDFRVTTDHRFFRRKTIRHAARKVRYIQPAARSWCTVGEYAGAPVT